MIIKILAKVPHKVETKEPHPDIDGYRVLTMITSLFWREGAWGGAGQ